MPSTRGVRKNRPITGKSPWTDDERRGLKILYERSNILNPDTPVNRVNFQRVFAHVFPVKVKKSYASLYDQYQPRFTISRVTRKPHRGVQWFVIDRPNQRDQSPYTQQELDDFARVETALQNAAVALGIPWGAPQAPQGNANLPLHPSPAPGVAADGQDIGEPEEFDAEDFVDFDTQEEEVEDAHVQEQDTAEEEQVTQHDTENGAIMSDTSPSTTTKTERLTLYIRGDRTRLQANIIFHQPGGAQLIGFDRPLSPRQWLPYLHVVIDCVWDGARAAYRASRSSIEAYVTTPLRGLPIVGSRVMALQRIYLDDDSELSMVALCRHEVCDCCAERRRALEAMAADDRRLGMTPIWE